MRGLKEKRGGEGEGGGGVPRENIQDRELGKGSAVLGDQLDIVRQEAGAKGGTDCHGGC